jgi:hypothetical protein
MAMTAQTDHGVASARMLTAFTADPIRTSSHRFGLSRLVSENYTEGSLEVCARLNIFRLPAQ